MAVSEFGCLGLDQDAERAEFDDVGGARREDEAADLRLHHDEPLSLQQAHGFAHRRAADAKGLREHLLGDDGTELQFAFDDRLTQPQHHLLRQRFWRIEFE